MTFIGSLLLWVCLVAAPSTRSLSLNKNPPSTNTAQIGLRVLDEEQSLAQSTFPIAPNDLIRRCQQVIAANLGTDDPETCLASNFEFVGPDTGPLNRSQHKKNTASILKAIKKSFPDVETNYYNFYVDPLVPGSGLRTHMRTLRTWVLTARSSQST